MTVAVLCSYGVAWIFFRGEVPQINALPAAAGVSAEEKNFSVIQFVVDIIPDDFVSPVEKGKVLQILFIAIFFGTTLNSLGDLTEIFFKMLSLLMFFMPPIVFFAMVHLALDTAAETVMLLSKLLVAEISVAALMIVFCPIFIRHVGKISPKPFLRKVPALMPTAFATASSGRSCRT